MIAFHTSPRRAFSLIELLVVIAILAVIAGLAASGVMKVRVMATRSDCQNRLRQQDLAILQYEAREGHLPPGSISGPFPPMQVPDGANHSLWAVLLNDLDQPAAASVYHWDVNFDDPLNQPAVALPIAALVCPAWNPSRIQEWSEGRSGGVSDYGPVEVNPFLADLAQIDPSEDFEGVLPVNGAVRMSEITDGASQTFLLVEAGRRPGMAWSSPSISVSVKEIIGGGAHLGGANVSMCDGSVHFLKAGADLKLLAKLATRGGGESIDGEW